MSQSLRRTRLSRIVSFVALFTLASIRVIAALPVGWVDADIGTVAIAGSADYDSGTDIYTFSGSGGGDISGSSDNFNFAYRALSGDGYIVARIDSLTNTNGWAKAGVMIRESLDANSRHALMMVTPSSGTGIKWRSSTGGSSSQVMVSGTTPRWVKLERRGKMITGFESSDGVNWSVVQRVAVAMGTDVYAGLVACSRTSGLTTVEAGAVTVGTVSDTVALPWPWEESTVGSPGDAGVALHDGSYILSNLGADITGTADRFKFVSQTLTGNGSLTMQISSVVSSDNSSRFGLMFRESQDANSRHVMFGVTTSKSLFFSSRRTTGGSMTSVQSSVTVTVPAWVRLEREGDVFKAWTSADGVTWALHGTETLPMGVTLQVGVAYSNRSASTWAIGVGDDLSLVTSLDTDGNGLSDDWEINYFSATGVDPMADPDADGLTNAQEWELGNDPLVFNLEGQRPLLELVSGNNQTGIAGTQLALPLTVRVKDSLSDDPLANIPVQFRVQQGEGALGSSLPGDPVLNLFSATDGQIQTAFQLPATGGDQIVGVGVGGRQQASVVIFTLKSLVGAAPGLFDVTNFGSPALPGRVTYSDGEYALEGATTSNFTGSTDTGTFAWRDFTGDGFILARVDHTDATDISAQVGVMFRESLDANSPYTSMLLTEGKGVVVQWRETVGGSTKVGSYQADQTGPLWLLVRRSGDTFTCFYSTDGQTWILKGTRVQSMATTLKVGFMHATKTSVYNHATISSLRLGSLNQAPWLSADIGAPRATAIDDFSEDAILMRSGGAGLGGTSDNVHFLYQMLPADGRLVTRLASMDSVSSIARTGLMVRESLASNSRHVSLLFSSGAGLGLYVRSSTGGNTSTVGAMLTDAVLPRWLRVDRIGNIINAYVSADGDEWSLIGTRTVPFTGPVLLGLAGGNYDTLKHMIARFEQPRLVAGEGALGWNGTYYDGDALMQRQLDRRDTDLDFFWPAGQSPALGVSSESYSVRWQGDVTPTVNETYTFKTLSQGRVRVKVDGQILIDRWTAHGLSEGNGSVTLQADHPVRVVVEYANTTGLDARVQLRWSAPGLAEQLVSFGSVKPIDVDVDGLPDDWEIAHGLNPADQSDGEQDPDNDGLTNRMEYEFGGNPYAVDDRLAGVVAVETWKGAGEVVRNLTSLDRFVASNPDSKSSISSLRFPTNGQNGYGRRVRGYLVPPVTGDYRFYIAANDSAEFWLSPGDNPFDRVKRARVGKTLTNDQDYGDRVEQRSVVLSLQAGQPYYFELLHKQNSGTSHVTVAWTGPGMTEPQVVTGAALASYAPVANDQDDDGLPDAWQASHGLANLSLPATARGAYGDADGDHLCNLLEYQHDLNPQEADTDTDTAPDLLELLVASDPLEISNFALGSWELGNVGDLSDVTLANRVGENAFRLAGTGTGLAIHKSDSFRYLYHSVEGDFELTTRMIRPADNVVGLGGVSIRSGLDDHAVSMSLLQDTEGFNRGYYRLSEGGPILELPSFTPAFASEDVGLAGYWFRIRRTADLVRLYYSVDGQQWMLAYAKSLPLGEECLVGFAIASNMGPFTSFSDVDLPAREFADISLDIDFVDPNPSDTMPEDATVTPVATLAGNAGTTVIGQWAADGNDLVSQTFTGTLDYTITVPTDGLYRLTFEALSTSNPSTSTLFPVEISVDGQFVARVDLVLPLNEAGLARIISPWLLAGTHTVRLFYDNTLSYHPLRIRSLTVEQLGGVDADSNGRADWIEARLAALNTLTAGDGALYVSPASLHGQARHRSLFALTADAVSVTTYPAPGYGWYADVPLSETAAVEVVGDFENTGHVQGQLLTWVPLNLLELPVEDFPTPTMQIRKGDSLRLTAYPLGATGGTANITITLPGETPVALALTDPVGQPMAHTFDEPGTYVVTATYTDAASNQTVADAFTVEVIEASFASDPVTGLNNNPVVWDNPLISDNVLIEVDQGVSLVDQGPLSGGGTRFAISSSNLAKSYIIARLGEDGPIFGHATVSTVRAATVSDTAMDLLQVYPDGSQLIGVPVIVNNLTDDTRVEIDIFVQGVTFEDGTTFKVLTKADFDEYGRIYLKFIYPAGVDGSICHRVRVIEGDVDLGLF